MQIKKINPPKFLERILVYKSLWSEFYLLHIYNFPRGKGYLLVAGLVRFSGFILVYYLSFYQFET